MDVELLRIRKLLPPPVGFFLLRSSMMNSIEDKAFTLKLYPTDGGTSRGMAKVKFKCGFFSMKWVHCLSSISPTVSYFTLP